MRYFYSVYNSYREYQNRLTANLLGILICSAFCSEVREERAGAWEEIEDTPVESLMELAVCPVPVPQIMSYREDTEEDPVPRKKGHDCRVTHSKAANMYSYIP